MSRAGIWMARVVLLIVSLGVTLWLGELVIARIAPQDLSIWDNTRDGITIHRRHADVHLPKMGRRIRTNGIGMRDVDHPPEPERGTTRILVLGDSFMEALQVDFEESFPALLEERLGDGSRPVEVVNLSVSGWGTDDQVAYLERYGLDLEPDGIVVMMTLHNDVSDNTRLRFHTLGPNGLVTRPIEPMTLPRYASQKAKAYLAGTSHLYSLAYQTWKRDDVRAGARQLNRHVASLLRRATPPEIERGWALTLALLDKAQRLADQRGAWIAIGLIPLRLQVEDDHYDEFLAAHGLTVEDMDRDRPQREVIRWASERDVQVVDLLPAFRERIEETGQAYYLPLDGHWNAGGHALAAKVMAQELSGRVSEPLPTADR